MACLMSPDKSFRGLLMSGTGRTRRCTRHFGSSLCPGEALGVGGEERRKEKRRRRRNKLKGRPHKRQKLLHSKHRITCCTVIKSCMLHI
ncbi:unnamed protein product [Linum tenue]|uniref:Uncharacterized protein n=1 Tax=Linum tenue TaxID=586396 RepID=A0AAV0NM32_9ROSI|nr:unnamed protein product [Linum tenue]